MSTVSINGNPVMLVSKPTVPPISQEFVKWSNLIAEQARANRHNAIQTVVDLKYKLFQL